MTDPVALTLGIVALIALALGAWDTHRREREIRRSQSLYDAFDRYDRKAEWE